MNPQSVINEPIPAPPSSSGLTGDAVSKSVQVKNILVPVDFSELSLKSLHYAIPLARQFGAKITLLYVVEPLTYSPEFPSWMVLPPDPAVEMRKELSDLRKARIPEDIDVDIAVYDDFVPSGVIEAARSSCADLIVITTHGRTGLHRLLDGSACEKIVRLAPCPVLALREPEREFV
ncbi:UspA domain protein [Chthoniobacter flavus Ellin428]|uniref:UspA domain protein n=1 Tax=Chthoniobacter flavus Ellin428 TaxID=497964 RepID=B4D2V1_9BACT|nr:universal stress protein [Chthoniobacter flavus]EDY19062.1 UspA domain protein [Chthoniobacter flavus Ellin428]TCO86825.1 nucleotide-binding universal stress UspA family protein [Chthoniobacter flavus]